MSDYILTSDGELMHYGVPGMKWGVRKRYLNDDGSLNDRGIKKYAKKGYAKDSYNSNKTRMGKAYDLYTQAHKHHASIKYDMASKNQNKARAEQYLKDKNKSKNRSTKEKAIRFTAKAAKASASVGKAYLTDQIFFNGAGTKAVKATTKAAGRAAITAYMRSRGATDIRWYD